MTTANERPFAPGTWVRRKNDASVVGQVVDCVWNDQVEDWRVRVQFGEGLRGVAASGLVAFIAENRNLWGDLQQGALGSYRQFVTRMTYERLKHPPAAIGHALGSARARFYPYQFKPLLKFLDHPGHRVLVADDVGLGKTIEAGYILREWRSRREVNHVLVVVPARLRSKWKNELNGKFGESFEVVDASRVCSMLRRVADGAPLEAFSWVASYESLRDEQIVDLLKDLELPLDMVILDEAHRVRNVGTKQYQMARALSAGAEAVVFLTATPVQTKLEDLFRLLDLLDPGTYGSESTFAELLEANTPIVRAAHLAAAGGFEEAYNELQELALSPHTEGLFNAPVFEEVMGRLQDNKNPTREEQIRLQQEIGDFSLTGAIISRTRKSEVMVDRPKRRPQTPTLPMSEAERAIYQAVAKCVRLIFPLASGWGQQMAALQFYRMTASCVPAAADMMGRKLKGEGWRALADAVLGDSEEGDEDTSAQGFAPLPPKVLSELERELLGVLARIPSREEDQKYLELRRVLREGWRDDDRATLRRRKVVIFANFRATLVYLDKSLRADGVQTRLIHGQIPISDREDRIAEFLEMRDVNVLLSSEVGGEGLDLQVANTVVNYDLPWNPMVVEQRIGRVDRLGQTSSTIHVVNLVLENTIEERIVARLYQRIHLFEQTIGEIDQILGNQVQELVVEALSGKLTESEQEQRALATADALYRQMNDLEQVNRRTDDLISADQALLDEVEQLQKRRRVPEPREVETLLMQFLEPRYPGIRLEGDAVRGVGSLELPPGLRRDFSQWARGASSEAVKWSGRLGSGVLSLTFDAEVALRHAAARVEHVQAHHPLLQFALHQLTEELKKQGESFGLRLCSPDLPQGTWVVGIWALDIQGTRRERRLGVAAGSVDGSQWLVGDDAEDLLVEALGAGEELDPRPELDPEAMGRLCAQLQDRMEHYVGRLVRTGREAEGRRLARRRATWSNTLGRQVERQRTLLERLEREGKREAILKMHRGKLKKVEAELKAKTEELSAEPEFEVEHQEICALLVVNTPKGSQNES
jgi:superfamily II DNA or RNA helicase